MKDHHHANFHRSLLSSPAFWPLRLWESHQRGAKDPHYGFGSISLDSRLLRKSFKNPKSLLFRAAEEGKEGECCGEKKVGNVLYQLFSEGDASQLARCFIKSGKPEHVIDLGSGIIASMVASTRMKKTHRG